MTANHGHPDEAPAYVLALDLAVWCTERFASAVRRQESAAVGGAGAASRAASGGVRRGGAECGPEVEAWREAAALARAACADVATALLLPGERRRALRALDRGLVRLRIEVRVADAAGLIDRRGARHVLDAADELGRMVGGWRRANARRDKQSRGHRAPKAPTASCAVAPTGTTRKPTLSLRLQGLFLLR